MKEQQCIKCDITKSISDFGKHSRTLSGFRSTCKLCRKQESRQYYTKNKGVILSKQKASRLENIDEHLRREAESREARREYIRAWDRDYSRQPEVKAKKASYSKKYRQENLEELKEKRIKFRRENIDHVLDREKRYRERMSNNLDYIDMMNRHRTRYRESNRQKINSAAMVYYYENHEEEKSKSRDIALNNSIALSDGYIRGLLCANGSVLTSKNIPQELIALKKIQIKIKRKLKEI